MNPTPPPAARPLTEGTALLSTRPPFIQSLLKLMMAVGGILTVLLSVASYLEFLPEKYAVLTGATTALLLALIKFIEAAGDLLDDGVPNGSFKLGRKDANNPALRQWFLFPLLLGVLGGGLASCATEGKTQKQLSLASAGVAAAEVALTVAEISLQEKLSDPDTPAWQVTSAKLLSAAARKTLAREQAKLDAALAALAAGQPMPPLDLNVPAITTSAKGAETITP